jgi:hypothetical protein
MNRLKQLVPVLLGFAVIVALNGGVADAARTTRTRDVCIASPTGGGSFNTLVFRDVDPLAQGGAVSLRGFYFVTGSQKLAPVHGSAVMGSDGRVRIGVFVHSTAESVNDFTVSGIADADFVGTLNFDNDGDFVTNGTLAMQTVDCATLVLP